MSQASKEPQQDGIKKKIQNQKNNNKKRIQKKNQKNNSKKKIQKKFKVKVEKKKKKYCRKIKNRRNN